MDISRTFEKMAESAVFLALGTVSYLQEIREHGDCYHQVMMAKALKKTTILMLDKRLLPSECEEIQQGLNGLDIIGTVLFDFDSGQVEDRAKNELKEILENWKKRTVV